MTIVVATARPEKLAPFMRSLAEGTGRNVETAPSGARTLERVAAEPTTLVVVDEGLTDLAPLQLVREILMVSAMTHTAVVTGLSEDDFHEAGEGYGVLMALPPNPGAADGDELAKRLSGV